jgi:tetratricopeptide (TPR) repeat protein
MLPVALVAAALSSASPHTGSETRGLRPVASPVPENGYRKCFALVIGINEYGDRAGGSMKLKNAVNDAAAVAEKLEKYGFKGEDQVFYFTDGKATRKGIEGAWQKLWKSRDKVGPDDCVLVFFSGHGIVVGEDTYLLPSDVEFDDQNKLLTKSAIKLADFRKELLDEIPARHKLLILDCCHAGGVFRLGGDRIDTGVVAPPVGAFDARHVAQAITSTRGTQEALDGAGGRNNSPFTLALIDALESIPTKKNKNPGEYQFTTTELYRTLCGQLAENVDLNRATKTQTPVCMYLDQARQGEFHFFPGKEKDIKFEPKFNDETVLHAMTPTTFGNWWGDEVPWFMPGLRHEILKNQPVFRSGILGNLDGGQLRKAAEITALRMAAQGEDNALVRRRGEDLKLLLGGMGGVGAKTGAIRQVRDSLREVVKNDRDGGDPLDLHYLAVLEHKTGDTDGAEKHYTAALNRYKELMKTAPRLYSPLYALCLSDLGTFELRVMKKYAQAADRFIEARSVPVYVDKTPVPFKVYTRMLQAEAYRRLGYVKPNDLLLDEAIDAFLSVDPNLYSPLVAATLKQSAWADMEQWRFKVAKDKFQEAQIRLRPHVSPDKGYEYRIDDFHISHGLAMVMRFQGRPADALEAYRKLTPEIADAIRDLDQKKTSLDYTDVRYLLYDRLVNCLQRQADCSLFDAVPDYAEAADDYRRALLETDNLSDDVRNDRKINLVYCRAIALAADSPVRDPDRAKRLYLFAERTRTTMKTIPLQTEICRSIAATLLSPTGDPTALDVDSPDVNPTDRPAGLPDMYKKLREEHRLLDRDELERMMFGYRLLIERMMPTARPGSPARGRGEVPEIVGERLEFLRLIDHMLRLCRQACRNDRPDPDLLRYLRPYYELAFTGKWAAGISTRSVDPSRPFVHPHVKELIEIAWEATQGTPYNKPGKSHPLLVLFTVRERACFLLDAPGFGNRCYVLNDLDRDALEPTVAADKAPALPLELLNDLRHLAVQLDRDRDRDRDPDRRSDTKLLLRWGDPYHRLGYEVVRGSAGKVDLEYLTEGLRPGNPFPYKLDWAISPARCQRCNLEKGFEPYARWRPKLGTPTALAPTGTNPVLSASP